MEAFEVLQNVVQLCILLRVLDFVKLELLQLNHADVLEVGGQIVQEGQLLIAIIVLKLYINPALPAYDANFSVVLIGLDEHNLSNEIVHDIYALLTNFVDLEDQTVFFCILDFIRKSTEEACRACSS